MPPIVISDSEDEDHKPDLPSPCRRHPIIDPSFDCEINELEIQRRKDRDECAELRSRLDKVEKRIEKASERIDDLVNKKNAALDASLKDPRKREVKEEEKGGRNESKKEVKKEGLVPDTPARAIRTLIGGCDDSQGPDPVPGDSDQFRCELEVPEEPDEPDAWAEPEPATAALPGAHKLVQAPVVPLEPRAEEHSPHPVRKSIIKEELSSDSENSIPRASRSISQSRPPGPQPPTPGDENRAARDSSIEIYEKVEPWVTPTEDNDRIAASSDPHRKFDANELIKVWPKLKIPNLPWPTIMFTRRFLSKVLGGGEQMVECVISAAKQRTQIYPIKVYYCERAEWSPDMPSEPGAHGVVYATAPDPRDAERPVDFNYSSYAVFCRRAANKWDYCGEYEITRRKFLPGEWGRISSIAKKSWSEGFSGKTGKKWGINTLMKRGLLKQGDPMPSPEDIIAMIDEGILLLECQIYKCVGYKRDFYDTLKEAWLREIEIDQAIKREEDEDGDGEVEMEADARRPVKKKRRLTTISRVRKGGTEEEEEEEEDIRLPTKKKRRLATTSKARKEDMEDGEEEVVGGQEIRKKRRRRRRIADDEEDDEDEEDEDYVET